MTKSRIWFESLLITLLVFVALWLLYLLINVSFKPLNYIARTISEINLNDLYFSSIANQQADTTITLINIEDLDRKGLALLLQKVAEAKPSVIGIDVFFSKELQTPDDPALMEALYTHRDHIVMATPYDDQGIPDEHYWHLPEIRTGHAGILTNKNNTQIVREFEPFIGNNDQVVPAFSAAIAEIVNPSSIKTLKQRNNTTEFIHYLGDENAFRILHYSDLPDTPGVHAFLKDKIVILGYLGGNIRNINDLHDVFFSPVGFDFSINRRPDMFGMVIHANLISMIINNHYINRVPMWLVYGITFLITLLYVRLMTGISVRFPLAFDAIGLLMQLAAFVLILWLSFLLFSHLYYYLSVQYLLVCIVLSVQVISLYELIAKWVSKLTGLRSVFHTTST